MSPGISFTSRLLLLQGCPDSKHQECGLSFSLPHRCCFLLCTPHYCESLPPLLLLSFSPYPLLFFINLSLSTPFSIFYFCFSSSSCTDFSPTLFPLTSVLSFFRPLSLLRLLFRVSCSIPFSLIYSTFPSLQFRTSSPRLRPLYFLPYILSSYSASSSSFFSIPFPPYSSFFSAFSSSSPFATASPLSSYLHLISFLISFSSSNFSIPVATYLFHLFFFLHFLLPSYLPVLSALGPSLLFFISFPFSLSDPDKHGFRAERYKTPTAATAC